MGRTINEVEEVNLNYNKTPTRKACMNSAKVRPRET
jgi:hypothetical protein